MKHFVTRTVSFLLALTLLSGTAAAAKQPTKDYTFPNDWSRDALVFAVENGILAGDENRNLHPSDSITRAEMAAVLVRLLGAWETADLSAYRDVPAGAWYTEELSAAVAAGIFSGVSSEKMSPEAPITREQAMVVLCRAFGLVANDRTAYRDFTDHAKISAYARDCVSAMKELEMVNGYSDGSLRPQSSITRAEVAQLLFKLLDCIADTPEEIPASGTVLYRGSEVPASVTLDGTLILGQAMNGEFTADGWQIGDSLIVRTATGTDADLQNATVGRLVCACTDGRIVGTASQVCLWSSSLRYTGDSDALIAVGGAPRAEGTYGTVELRSGSLTLAGSAREVTQGEDTVLTLNGEAETVILDGSGAAVRGSGHAGTVRRSYERYEISVDYDTLDDRYAETYQKEHDNARNVVKTMKVACRVERETALFTNQNLTGYIKSIPAGETVYNEWHPSGSVTYVSCSDGSRGWINRWDCYIPDDEVFVDGDLDYSKATKEGFVDLNNYASDTEYLIWVSRYTQKVMVYQGQQGDWELIKTLPCASGENNTPTPEGVYEISSRTTRWNFDYYYVENVSIFSGGHAFHSVLYNYDGSVYDDRVGQPLSHGCVRMTIPDCNYIYNLPEHTRVVVY